MKRTPVARGTTPLAQGKPLARGGPLRRTQGPKGISHLAAESAKRRRERPAYTAWRLAVLKRDLWCQGRIEVECARKQRVSTVAHHILPVGKGGRRYDLANGVGLCWDCHYLVHQDARGQALAKERGILK